MAIVNGTKGGFLQPLRYGRDSSGAYVIYPWHGTRSEVLGNAAWVEQQGGTWEMRESYSGAKCVLEGRIPQSYNGGSDQIDTWEFFAQVAEKDILNSDIAAVSGLNDENRENINHYLDVQPPDPGVTPIFTSTGDWANADAIYQLMRSGVRSIEVNVPTLRHTATASSGSIVKAVLTNVGRIISTPSLFTLEGVPNSVLFALPNDTSARTGFAYGWKKKHPTIRGAARQKVQIEREWQYGLWPTLLYGSVL